MKASVGGGILLLLVLLLVIFNAGYVQGTTRSMEERIAVLPDEPTAEAARGIEELRAYWEIHQPWLRLTVSFSLTDRVSELAASLEAYAEGGAETDYTATKALLWDAVKDVRRLEDLWAAPE